MAIHFLKPEGGLDVSLGPVGLVGGEEKTVDGDADSSLQARRRVSVIRPLGVGGVSIGNIECKFKFVIEGNLIDILANVRSR